MRYLLTFGLAVFVLTGRAADKPEVPQMLRYNDVLHLVESAPISALKRGDHALIRVGDGFAVADVGSFRGADVYRMIGSDTKFISPGNYVGRLVEFEAFVKSINASINAATSGLPAGSPVPEAAPVGQKGAAGAGSISSPPATPPAPVAAAPSPVSAPAARPVPAASSALAPTATTPPVVAARAETRPAGTAGAGHKPDVSAAPMQSKSAPVPDARSKEQMASFYDDLLKLEDLRIRGILTDTEFQEAKRRVLGRIQ